MVFPPDQPDFRLAVLFPHGLAMSPDAGQTWTALADAIRGANTFKDIGHLQDLLAPLCSAFVATTGAQGSVYLSLIGQHSR